MPTDLDEAIDIVASQIEELGDEVSDIDEIEDDGDRYKWIVAEEATYGCTFVVSGKEGIEKLTVAYDYSLIDALVNSIESSEDLYDLGDFEEASPYDAAGTLINRVDQDDLNRLKFELHDNISNPLTASRLVESEEVPLTGFQIFRAIFPREPDYSIRNFYNAQTAVTSTGEVGKRYLTNAFAIQISEEKPEEDVSIAFDPDTVFSEHFR